MLKNIFRFIICNKQKLGLNFKHAIKTTSNIRSVVAQAKIFITTLYTTGQTILLWLKKNNKLAKWIFAVTAFTIIYYIFFTVNINQQKPQYGIDIPENANFEKVVSLLKEKDIILNESTFRLAASVLGYTGKEDIHRGKFLFKERWGNFQLVQYLKRKYRRPVTTITIRPYRFRRNILSNICDKVDVSHRAFAYQLIDRTFARNLGGFNNESVYCMFLPGKYYIYKDCSKKELARWVFNQYQHFWTPEKIKKAAQMGLNTKEVVILASIVYAETKNHEEMPTIAGLYINRLEQGMRLQSDPTLVYANGNTMIDRILYKHKKSRSPYNTYRYEGLPPGPVFTPARQAIEAVLNYEEHNYLYFCAKDDFSGRHSFSKTYQEHLKKAHEYHIALDKHNIH